MKICEVIKAKRNALGLSQVEFGNLCGLSGSAISSFESGKEVSELVFKSIKYGLDKYVSRLPKEECLRYQVVCKALILEKEPDEEKLRTLHYLTIAIGRYELYLSEKES